MSDPARLALSARPEPFGESAYAEDSNPHGADRSEDGPDEDEGFDERECGVEGLRGCPPWIRRVQRNLTVIPTIDAHAARHSLSGVNGCDDAA